MALQPGKTIHGRSALMLRVSVNRRGGGRAREGEFLFPSRSPLGLGENQNVSDPWGPIVGKARKRRGFTRLFSGCRLHVAGKRKSAERESNPHPCLSQKHALSV